MPPFRRFRLAGFKVLGLFVVACSASMPPSAQDGIDTGGTTTTPASSTLCSNGRTPCDGRCVDVATSTDHCGACETRCNAGDVCNLGSCVGPGGVSCEPGLTSCGATCFDLRSDREHCGTCGSVCKAGESCTESSCLSACPPGSVRCAKACIEPNANPTHCGATPGCGVSGGSAGVVCGAGESCFGGQCIGDCESGLTHCPNGACVDVDGDRANCGACGHACAPGKSCSHRICCAAGFEACMGVCRDTDNDEGACGGCGIVCNPGDSCVNGRCK
jgi:hypothetical protein